jgi:hypothetical protein
MLEANAKALGLMRLRKQLAARGYPTDRRAIRVNPD